MMSKDDFLILTVSNVTPDEADIISAFAFDAGAEGTEEELAFEQKSREYEPVTLTKDRTCMKIYFTKPPEAHFIESISAMYPHADVQLKSEAHRDWLAEWKKSFQSFCLAGDTWIVPSWCEPPIEAKKIIRIDPGMAFGTGTHETTRLAAGFVDSFAKNRDSFLDVGTGTGILAIQAELAGFSKVVANDIDEEARRVARENVNLNQSQVVKIVDADLSQIPGEFDWVVANIIDGVLVKLQNDLHKRVAPKGFLLLTGILAERDDLFRSEFSFSGFRIVERRTLGEWVGYLLERE
ncbi:MAG: 50S ribosomal protein L11 methyltransferase [Bdellovibrionales bacterium]|nr:50S ribosomal protein L11 methyltransferase [Bdellovibrionales bacterium]